MTRETTDFVAAPNMQHTLSDLRVMLTYMRPGDSATEFDFCQRFIAPLGAKPDPFGNFILEIPERDGSRSPILWSSHTDTVHSKPGKQKLRQKGAMIYSDSNCLGADCTTGVWLMQQMALARVPGLYIWHALEERGCQGSSFIREHTPEKLSHIRFAIAFDRKGYNEIITHQVAGRTASDEFALSLAAALYPSQKLIYEPSDRGIYTDTNEYAGIVPECTNISVGYFNQHTSDEHQDLTFAAKLLRSLLTADFSQLVCKRDPTVHESSDYEDSNWFLNYGRESTKRDNSAQLYNRLAKTNIYKDLSEGALENFCFNNAEAAAFLLSALGYTKETAIATIEELIKRDEL